MALDIIGLESNNAEPEGQRFFRTADWERTMNAHNWFQGKMFNQLREKQEEGRGYFEEAKDYDLRAAMERAMQEGRFVDVANYAMMLAYKDRIQEEKERFQEFHSKKLADHYNGEDDDLSFLG